MGQAGYIYVSNQLFHGNMIEAYKRTSKAFNKAFIFKLGWGKAYHGTTEGFQQERQRLLINGRANPEFIGLEGYIKYADRYYNANMNGAYNGNMHRAYVNMSAVLSEKEKNQMGFGRQYHGTTKEFHEERLQLLINGRANPEFIGLEGYIKYADRYYNGQMLTVHLNMSAVLSAKEKKQMGWGKAYQGTTKEFQQERRRLLINGRANPEFIGPEGLFKYVGRIIRERKKPDGMGKTI